jgi:hypothetical protein
VNDDCGVCDGDGSSCDEGCGPNEPGPSGCDNTCGSILVNDDCGVCDGDGSSCDEGCGPNEPGPSGCDNTCGSILVNDDCGVCDGDGSSCDEGCGPNEPGPLGCDNICGSTLAYDECGYCGGDGCYQGDCNLYPADQFDCDGVLLANDLFSPFEFRLLPNSPNPFNPITTINYSIAIFSEVNISIYSINGKLIQILVNSSQQPGQYVVQWNASNFPSGLYFVKLISSNKKAEQKVLLIK